MTKKKIVAIILFLFLSLFMFTFANPGDDTSELKEPSKIKDEINKKEKEEQEEVEEENEGTFVNANDGINDLNTRNTDNNTTGNNAVNNNNTTKKLDAPVIKITDEKIIILLGEDYDLMSGVEVISEEKLSVKTDITDTTKLPEGRYTVNYTVTDSEGNTGSATREIVVIDPNKDNDNDGFTNGEEIIDGTDPLDKEKHKDTDKPTIKVEPKVVSTLLGEKYDLTTGVTVTVDSHNKKEANEYLSIDTEYDANTLGRYEVTYSVEDDYGKTASETRTIVVLAPKGDEDGDGFTNGEEISDGTDPLNPENHKDTDKPTIKVEPKVVSTLLGKKYDLTTGVTVTVDSHNKKEANEYLSVDTEYNENTLGRYEVTYSVEDDYNKTASETRTIVVLDPTVDEDGDGFKNGEEIIDGTDPLDKEKHKDTDKPTIKVEPKVVSTLLGKKYDLTTGVTVTVDSHNKKEANEYLSVDSEYDANTLGRYEVTYSVEDDYNKTASETRTIVVLAPKGDEDGDGFTNGEEISDETDPLDKKNHKDTEEPIITLDKDEVIILVNDNYDLTTGVTVTVDSHNKYASDPTHYLTVNAGNYTNKTAGTYTITYSVEDDYNKTTTKTRTVIVSSDENNNKIPDVLEKKYLITWKNEDDRVLKVDEVLVGLMPSYKGETPEKQADGQYTYKFKGWNPKVSVVAGAATYYATYEAIPITPEFKKEHNITYKFDKDYTPDGIKFTLKFNVGNIANNASKYSVNLKINGSDVEEPKEINSSDGGVVTFTYTQPFSELFNYSIQELDLTISAKNGDSSVSQSSKLWSGVGYKPGTDLEFLRRILPKYDEIKASLTSVGIQNKKPNDYPLGIYKLIDVITGTSEGKTYTITSWN